MNMKNKVTTALIVVLIGMLAAVTGLNTVKQSERLSALEIGQVRYTDIMAIVASEHAVLDLSVLNSCGIITDGYGHGSCVAVRPNLILTAGHCIDAPDTWVEIQGVRYEILSKWRSDVYDIGFAWIDGDVPYVELGKDPPLLLEVYAVGAPYEMSFINSITRGIISALDRDVYDHVGLIQTDAEGAPGSSGGPLFDPSGRIVGICVVGPNPGGGVVGYEPVSHISEALDEYMKAFIQRSN